MQGISVCLSSVNYLDNRSIAFTLGGCVPEVLEKAINITLQRQRTPAVLDPPFRHTYARVYRQMENYISAGGQAVSRHVLNGHSTNVSLQELAMEAHYLANWH